MDCVSLLCISISGVVFRDAADFMYLVDGGLYKLHAFWCDGENNTDEKKLSQQVQLYSTSTRTAVVKCTSCTLKGTKHTQAVYLGL